jgi:hypothetical protein
MSETLGDDIKEVGEHTEQLLEPVELAQLVVKGVAGSIDSLSDEELEQIVNSTDVAELLKDAGYHGIAWCRTELTYRLKRKELLAYRLKRKELDELSTDELRSQYDAINQRRSQIAAGDFADDLPDSFYEVPSKDSDSHILHELLKEREAI